MDSSRQILKKLQESRRLDKDPVVIGYNLGQLADREFYTDLDDLVSDLETIGCEVGEANEEYISIFVGDEEYKLSLSGGRSFVIESIEKE